MSNYTFIAEEIRREIETFLFGLGFLCRVFARGKDEHSLMKKLERTPGKYALNGKLIQDMVGIRVVLYFPEDIEIVKNLLCKRYAYDAQSSNIDRPENDQFSVSRYNLIFSVPDSHKDSFRRLASGRPVDNTFEVQLRTMLSEGWHEVEHDLRYKTADHWHEQGDLSRALNGIMATIETSEWSMRRVFDELAYRHYKKKNWGAMLHSKLRMRLQPTLSSELCKLFDADLECAKDMYRIDREFLLQKFAEIKPRIPINLDNLVYVWNYHATKREAILAVTPDLILEALVS